MARLPTACAASNQIPRPYTTRSASHVCGQKLSQSQASIRALKPKPRTKQASANGTRLRSSGAASAPATPQAPQPSICHGVHGPWPSRKFEANAASAPVANPARAPSATPAATTITVTGCTPGTAAKSTRPAAATAARVATRVISRAASGPDSSQAAPAAKSATASRTSGSAARSGQAAVQAAAANAAASAPAAAALGIDGLAGADVHDPVRDVAGEDRVVRDEQRCAAGRAAAQEIGQLCLAIGVDASCRLVEDEQVGLGDEDGRGGEPLALAAREVARMAGLVAREADVAKRGPGRRKGAADPESHLLVHALADEVAAGILREVAGAAVERDAAALWLEEAGRDLAQRRLARPVRPHERDDLAAPEVG